MRHVRLEKGCHPFRSSHNNHAASPLLGVARGVVRAYLDGGVREVFRRSMRKLMPHPPGEKTGAIWLTDLQPVSCEVCGAEDTCVVVPDDPVSIVRCNSCGLIYYNLRPTDEALREYYSAEADGTYTLNLHKWQHEVNSQMTQLWIEDFNVLEEWSSSLPSMPPRFLDVGCATGFQLLSAKRKGWEPVGIEPSELIAAWVKEQYGLDVVQGTFEEAAVATLPKESFDLILMSHILEHMPHPSRAVHAAFSLLKRGGLIAIYVPNGDGIQARNDFKKWEWKGFPDHLYFFTHPVLARLLTECGFRAESMWTCVGHSNREQLFGLIQQCLCLDSLEQAKRVAEVLGPMCLLSDLRVMARKPTL